MIQSSFQYKQWLCIIVLNRTELIIKIVAQLSLPMYVSNKFDILKWFKLSGKCRSMDSVIDNKKASELSNSKSFRHYSNIYNPLSDVVG